MGLKYLIVTDDGFKHYSIFPERDFIKKIELRPQDFYCYFESPKRGSTYYRQNITGFYSTDHAKLWLAKKRIQIAKDYMYKFENKLIYKQNDPSFIVETAVRYTHYKNSIDKHKRFIKKVCSRLPEFCI